MRHRLTMFACKTHVINTEFRSAVSEYFGSMLGHTSTMEFNGTARGTPWTIAIDAERQHWL